MRSRTGRWALLSVGAAMVICLTFAAQVGTGQIRFSGGARDEAVLGPVAATADDAPWGALDMARVREGLEAMR